MNIQDAMRAVESHLENFAKKYNMENSDGFKLGAAKMIIAMVVQQQPGLIQSHLHDCMVK